MKFVAALGSLTFAMITVAVGTVAWFVASARQQVNGMSIETESPDMGINYTIYKYDQNLKQGVGYENDPNEFYLPAYEDVDFLIDDNNNQYANVILKTNINFVDFNPSTSEIVISFNCSNDYKYLDQKDGKEKYYPITSNVAQYKCLVSSYTYEEGGVQREEIVDSSLSGNTAAEIYSNASARFAIHDTPTTYISINSGSSADTIYFDKVPGDLIISPCLEERNIHVTSATVFIECSYNEKLIKEYIANHKDDKKTVNNQEVYDESWKKMEGDVETIRFGVNTTQTHGAINSGKYVRVTSNYNFSDGKYLPVYTDGSTGKHYILDGSLAVIGSSASLYNADPNFKEVEVNGYSIGSNIVTNSAAFTYDPTEDVDESKGGTLTTSGWKQSPSTGSYSYDADNKAFMGAKNASNPTITTLSANTASNAMRNKINVDNTTGKVNVEYDYLSNEEVVKKYFGYGTYQSKERFAYANSDAKNIEMYRYFENAHSHGTLQSIEIVGDYNDEAWINDPYTFTGLIKAKYSDGGSYPVTNQCTFDALDVSTIGEKTIKAYYCELSNTTNELVNVHCSFTVTVKVSPIDSITVKTEPNKHTYYKGETFDPTGLVITVHPEHGPNYDVEYNSSTQSSFSFSGTDFSTAGVKTVTITYGEKETTLTYDVLFYRIVINADSSRSLTWSLSDGAFQVSVKTGVDDQGDDYFVNNGLTVTWVSGDTTKFTTGVTTGEYAQSVIITPIAGCTNVTLTAKLVNDNGLEVARDTVNITIKTRREYKIVKSTDTISNWNGEYLITSSSTGGNLWDASENLDPSVKISVPSDPLSSDFYYDSSSEKIIQNNDEYDLHSKSFSFSNTDNNLYSIYANGRMKYLDGSTPKHAYESDDPVENEIYFDGATLWIKLHDSDNRLRWNSDGDGNFRYYDKDGVGVPVTLFKLQKEMSTVSIKNISNHDYLVKSVPSMNTIRLSANVDVGTTGGSTIQSWSAYPDVVNFTLVDNNPNLVDVTPKSGAQLGNVVITASLGGYTSPAATTLYIKEVDSFSIQSEPTVLNYRTGSNLDPTGLALNVQYKNDDSSLNSNVIYYSSSNSNDFTFSPSISKSLETTDSNVSVTYGGYTVNNAFEIEVDDVILPQVIDYGTDFDSAYDFVAGLGVGEEDRYVRRVKAKVTSIRDTSYGNLYLSSIDGLSSNSLYVYGCFIDTYGSVFNKVDHEDGYYWYPNVFNDLNTGGKFQNACVTSDVITIEFVSMNYNGTPEIKGNIISVEKGHNVDISGELSVTQGQTVQLTASDTNFELETNFTWAQSKGTGQTGQIKFGGAGGTIDATGKTVTIYGQTIGQLTLTVSCSGGNSKIVTFEVTDGQSNYLECVYKHEYFSEGVSSYSSNFTVEKPNDNKFINTYCYHFNNNNLIWDYIKCGNKNGNDTSYIDTMVVIPFAVKKVTLSIDAITTGNVTSIELYSSDNYQECKTKLGTFSKAVGDISVTINNPQSGLYYAIKVVTTKSSSNGTLTISKLTFE